jgi:hypothetical protein
MWFCEHNAQKLKNVHRGFRTSESRRLRPHSLGRKQVRTELVHHKKGQTDDHRLARRPPGHAENRNVRPPLLLAAARGAAIAVAPLAEAASTAPACIFSGPATICQTDGNAQVSGSPPWVDYQSQYPLFGYNGLLFHHRARTPETSSVYSYSAPER